MKKTIKLIQKKIKKAIKSRKLITIALISSSIIIEFVLALRLCFPDKTYKFAETLYYICQIISSFFVTSGVIIAVWQYYLSSKSTKTNLEIQQIQRAIDLSGYYKDNILKYYPAIKYIFRETKIADIIGNLRIRDLQDFDLHELKTLIPSKDIKELKEIEKSSDFAKIILAANSIYGLNINLDENDNDTKAIWSTYMSDLICKILNDLEYFALHFSHHTADESVVYQSLHQTYLDIVTDLYYEIASKNIDFTEKYYTNVIWLFNTWRKKKEKKNNKRSKKSLLIQDHGNIVHSTK